MVLVRGVLERALEGWRFRVGLDLGCGIGQWGMLFRRYCDYLIGVDFNEGDLKRASETDAYDELVRMDIREYQPPPETEAVFQIEVLEHLEKGDGLRLLERLKWVPFFLITTPKNYFHGPVTCPHVSIWSHGNLQTFGFQTEEFRHGFGGLFRTGIIAVRTPVDLLLPEQAYGRCSTC